jgi:hypothetical protein
MAPEAASSSRAAPSTVALFIGCRKLDDYAKNVIHTNFAD